MNRMALTVEVFYRRGTCVEWWGTAMSKRSIFMVLAGAAAVLGGCADSRHVAWTTPGWYLELPYAVIGGGPRMYGGPYSYDQCEDERKKTDVPNRLLCVNETKQPQKFGFY